MLSIVVAIAMFGLACSGLRSGMWISNLIPKTHLTAEARSAAQLGVGMLATLAALVLGLMITSAKTSFDERSNEVISVATSMVLLDRALAGYGAPAVAARGRLQAIYRAIATRVSSHGDVTADEFRTPLSSLAEVTQLQASILELAPSSDSQRWFQARALTLSSELARERVITVERGDRSIPTPLLVVVTVWVALIFLGIGLFNVSNRTVTAALVVCAFGFACAMFLIMELDTPYSGIIGISSRPLENAAAEMGH